MKSGRGASSSTLGLCMGRESSRKQSKQSIKDDEQTRKDMVDLCAEGTEMSSSLGPVANWMTLMLSQTTQMSEADLMSSFAEAFVGNSFRDRVASAESICTYGDD